MNKLLLISCSQRKREDEGLLPAIERYDGPVYRCLRKMIREETYPVDEIGCLIISAKYGLITAQACIEFYDQKMTAARAVELRYEVQQSLSRYLSNRIEQVFINLGKDYMDTLEGFNWGVYPTLEASGGIGMRTSQMKYWILQVGFEDRMKGLVELVEV